MEEVVVEMEACGGRGDGAGLLGVDGLVAVAVGGVGIRLALALDVWWQGHDAVSVEDLEVVGVGVCGLEEPFALA